MATTNGRSVNFPGPLPTPGSEVRLWIDDERAIPEGWICARTAAQAKFLFEAAKSEGFTIVEVSFDHDLGLGESGYDVATWLEEHVAFGHLPAPAKLGVHSANSVGVFRLWQTIESIYRLADGSR